MRANALEHVACPICKSALHLEAIAAQEGQHIISGTLRCRGCSVAYPILRGIPRLLPSAVRTQDLVTGEAYAEYFSQVTSGDASDDSRLYGKTVQEEIADFCTKIGIDDLSLLSDKALLDAACGLARIEGALAEHCRVIVAFDITPAVDQAFIAWKHLSNVHVVQGDLVSMPVPLEHFDCVWCDGGLPYVSDLEAALKELLRSRSPTGYLYSWCYSSPLTIKERVGRLLHTTRLPIRARFPPAYAASWLIKAAVSLADRVNFVSESQIRSLLSEYLTQDTRFQTAKRGRSTEFRVGWVD
jgi:uncharacterized protein YbaR (Trm112 family)/SAM-dependent methyltransferase